jgi:hypothetical protein
VGSGQGHEDIDLPCCCEIPVTAHLKLPSAWLTLERVAAHIKDQNWIVVNWASVSFDILHLQRHLCILHWSRILTFLIDMEKSLVKDATKCIDSQYSKPSCWVCYLPVVRSLFVREWAGRILSTWLITGCTLKPSCEDSCDAYY